MSSVHYLTPGTSTWIERTTEDAEDLIADPFWRIKQSSDASKDAIVIRCGLGYIKRSVDGGAIWSTVTPTTNPPNGAGDSPAPIVGNVTFSQLDSSLINQDEFIVIATWKNVSNEWRTWLYYSSDSFATDGTWAAIGGYTPNDDLDAWQASSAVDLDQSTSLGASPTSGTKLHHHSSCKISDNKVVVAFWDNFESGLIEVGYCRVIDIAGDGSLSVGPRQGSYNFEDLPNTNRTQMNQVYTWDSSHFILITVEEDWEFGLGFRNRLLARMCSVGGTTITFGSPIYVNPVSIDDNIGDFNFCRTPGVGDWGIITMSDRAISPLKQDDGWVTAVQKTGDTTIIKGTNYSFETGAGAGVNQAMPVMHTETNGVIWYNTDKDFDGNGVFHLYYLPITVVGLIITLGSRASAGSSRHSRHVKAVILTDVKGVILEWDINTFKLNTITYSRSGSTYTLQDVVEVVTSGNIPNSGLGIETVSKSRWAVFWDQIGSDGVHVKLASLSGVYAHQYGTQAVLDESGSGFSLIFISGAIASEDWVFGVVQDTAPAVGETIRASVVALPVQGVSQYEIRGLGVSIGKGTSDKAWMTIWTPNEIFLLDIAIPTFTLNNLFAVGNATEAEVGGKTWIAYPYGVIGSDNTVVVFGRMDTPQGLSLPEHIIYTINGGASFISVENGWVNSYCGSLLVTASGWVYAIRNDGNNSRFYFGTLAGITVQSVLPFMSGVEQHGLDVDSRDGAIVACARVADPYMVAVSAYPYTLWTNITADHGVLEGINAVAIL